MENDKKSSYLEFTDSNKLKLQQLLTNQALVSNVQKKEAKNIEQTVSSSAEILGEGELWKLIPPNINLYEWQKLCLNIWLPKGRGTVKVATGGGKTLFALAAAQKLQNEKFPDLRLAIVVPTIPLMNQWREELNNSNLHDSQIGMLGGNNKFTESSEMKIILAVINSAREKLPAIVKSMNWQNKLLLVVDECHRSNSEKSQKIFNTMPKYTLGLSATPEVNTVDDSELSIDDYEMIDIEETYKDPKILSDSDYSKCPAGKALGEIIHDFSLKNCLEAGLLTKFNVFHVGLELNSSEAEKHKKMSLEIGELKKELDSRFGKSKKGGNFIAWCQSLAKKDGEGDAARFIGLANERKRLLYSASSRKTFTLKILKAAVAESEVNKNDSKVIVFHESIKDVNEIYYDSVIDGLPAVLEQSELTDKIRSNNIELFRQGISKIIVSARSLVEGFNVPSADIGIIAASSGSVRQRIQSLGRMLRKSGTSKTAVIFALYIKDTEDESIYEKENWETVLGSERNRYFHWTDSDTSCGSPKSIDEVVDQLVETGEPPRKFRPSCREIDITTLKFGDKYPAQTKGQSVRVDYEHNLKTDDGQLVQARKDQIEKISQISKNKYATLTPCGHLICIDSSIDSNDRWIYLETVEIPDNSEFSLKEKFKFTTKRGKRVIVKTVGRDEYCAVSKEKADDNSENDMLSALIQWLSQKEIELGTKITNLYWDGETKYWIEVNGERITYEKSGVALEF